MIAALTRAAFLGGLLAFAAAGPVAAQGQVVVYCSMQEDWCNAAARGFEQASGIRVAMTRRSSGETYALIRAEAANPRGDVWFGGTGDPHLQAAEEGLLEEYRSPMLEQLQPWALRQAEQARFRTVGIYAGALGYSYNRRELERRRIAPPTSWADLLRPEFRGEIQVANPNSSGTSYTMLATLVQLMGEEQAFQYLRQLHRNIAQYTRSGAAPARAAATGEALIGITFQHDAVAQAVQGAPLVVVSPAEGTGYEIGSMSIIRGARNMENARRFYDWALSVEAMAIMPRVQAFQVPANRNAPVPPEAPDLSSVRLIDYDFARWGSSAERTRLLARWDREVGALPR
jgi:iron(III) transport system substrate-binding protein